MLDLPIAVDAPARDAVVVLVGEAQRSRHRLLWSRRAPRRIRRAAAARCRLRPRRGFAGRRLAIPAPRHAEARERLVVDRALQRGLAPALAAVGRDHDLGDAAGAGIGDAGNLIEARLLQAVAEDGWVMKDLTS